MNRTRQEKIEEKKNIAVACTSWKILKKFPDGIVLSICSINSSVKSVHQQTLETNKIRKKLDEAQPVFLQLFKNKRYLPISCENDSFTQRQTSESKRNLA